MMRTPDQPAKAAIAWASSRSSTTLAMSRLAFHPLQRFQICRKKHLQMPDAVEAAAQAQSTDRPRQTRRYRIAPCQLRQADRPWSCRRCEFGRHYITTPSHRLQPLATSVCHLFVTPEHACGDRADAERDDAGKRRSRKMQSTVNLLNDKNADRSERSKHMGHQSGGSTDAHLH